MTDTTTNLSGLEWAKVHGERFRFHALLDNHEPARDYAYGDIYRYDRVNLTEKPWLIDNRDVERLIFKEYAGKMGVLLDDGRTVRPMYVTGWNHGGSYFMVAPMPINFDEAGEPIMRHDHPDRQVDFKNWMLGPRRFYHLKIYPPKEAE